MSMHRIVFSLMIGLGFLIVTLGAIAGGEVARASSSTLPLFTTLTVGLTPGCATIQQCIDSAGAGDTILIPSNTYNNQSLMLNKPVSLIGQDSATTIIQAATGQRVLAVTGAAIDSTVVISGLTLSGGQVIGGLTCPTYCGGGVLISDNAQPRLHNIIIRNNQAGGSGGGLYAALGSPLTLMNTGFFSNTATVFGGGASISDDATVTGGHFEDNWAGDRGGGLEAQSVLTLNDTNFIGNRSRIGGGAHGFGSVTITASYFENNTAWGGGGLNVPGTLTIHNTTFIRNSAETAGGGAVVGGTATFYGGRFEGNTAGFGGGGLVVSSTLTMNDTTFIDNIANTGGGGIFALGAATLTRGYFEGNVAQILNGGGLIVSDTLSLVETDFISNTSGYEGGGVFVFGPVEVLGGHFERNRAVIQGGGLVARNTLTMMGSTFRANTVDDFGGGALVIGPAIIRHTRFEGNRAGRGSGGLELGQGLVDRTDFIGNTADFGGGMRTFGPAVISDSRFEANIATTGGGGLINDDALQLVGVTFISNTARFDGGGLLAIAAVEITASHFERNRCLEMILGCNGGALEALAGLSVAETQFIENSAVFGGGIAHFGNQDGQVINALFARNTANWGTALSLVSGGRVAILHSTIANANFNSLSSLVVYSGTVGITNTLFAHHGTGIAQVAGLVFEDYNLFFNISTPKFGAVAGGGHSLSGDPKFINPADDNYRLSDPDSAAVDRGVNAGIMRDLAGNARPWGDGFDIGAYELGTTIYLPLVFKHGS